ncbi:hypothetical protein IP79_10450 [Porphyrobacter sp. AAP60]|nr:hypothetical protein IP79_10450 [Porphyrobacter sp. AAP60]
MMLAVPLGGALWLGMGPADEHYDVPPVQVLTSLSNATVPTHVLGSHIKGSRVTRPDNKTVVTALIGADGAEMMRFVTTVKADGEGSSVSTEIEPPVGKNAERAAKAMQSQAYTMALMEKLAQEHVDAAIEKRPFNLLALNPAGDAMINADPRMKEQIQQANEAAAMMSRMEQEEFRSADQSGGWGANTPKRDIGWGTNTPRQDSDWPQ